MRPLRGLYARNRVYEGVTGMEAFDPWIRRVKNFTDRVLEEFAKEIPPEWYYDDFDALNRLLEQLLLRVNRLEELILDAEAQQPPALPKLALSFIFSDRGVAPNAVNGKCTDRKNPRTQHRKARHGASARWSHRILALCP